MLKIKRFLFGFFGAYLFMALSLAHAENPGPEGTSPKWHAGQRIQEIYSQLNLTVDQKNQLEANKQDHRARMQSIRKEIKVLKDALQTQLMKPQLDMSKINGIHNMIKSMQSQLEDVRLSSILAVREILTPEQFLKFVNLMHKHEESEEHQK
jgi:protein CpxP